ncbi:MAG: MBL fold metallo-hydrolase, partial [Planctomycetota bacterium]|jgi:glyoxylase-like metal-dependent hydrolase (beta-lactamase superfamily II)
VPKALWERQIPADDRNRVGLAARALLLEEIEGERKILVDTGLGQKWGSKLADIYGVDHSKLRLETSLEAKGLRTGDITDVLLTHLHFDHAGGATKKVDGKILPTFENAKYFVQTRNLAWAHEPTEKDRASYMREDYGVLEEEGVLETLDGGGEWLPGIELIMSEGHTTAMQLPHVHGPEGHLVYCADMIPTAAHVPVPWVMAYDNQPLVTMQEKHDLLAKVAAEDWVLFFEHDPQGPASRVTSTEKGYRSGERVQL